jgi:hypothetical protein
MDKAEGQEATAVELQRRMLFALLRPVVRLGARFRVPLKVIEELCRLAYFEQLRHEEALSQQETAKLLGRSLRTIGHLEKQYKGDFLAPEDELSFLREVEDALSEGALALGELKARFSGELWPEGELERAVQSLVSAGRLEAQEGGARYALNRSYQSLVREDLSARLDGLKHQLDVVTNAITARFFKEGEPSMARTLAFVADEQDMQEMLAELVRTLRSRCVEVEERALEKGRFRRFALTFAAAPMDDDQTP